MRRVSAVGWALFFLVLANPRLARGGDDWQPILPEELKMITEPKAPGAPAVYLYRQVDRDDQAGREINYARIKILTEEGRKNADVEVPFYKNQGNIRGIKARTIHSDGSIAEFDGKVYEKTIVKARGVSVLAKTFTLPDVQVGSIIEYRYVKEWGNGLIYDSNWTLSWELFTKQAKFSLRPSSDYAVSWNWNNLPPGTIPPKDEKGQISLTAQDIPSFPTEDYMPPEGELQARVNFIYTESVEKDSEKFWKEYTKRKSTAIEAYAGKGKAMEQAVATIVSSGDAPEVKLQKIYARVQQLRNLSFEKEKTEQEQKRQKIKDLNNVEDIWKDGYGYGAGINWLFMALARAAGFEANPVFASARAEHFFHPKLMNAFELNSNMVVVKVEGKDVFCDPATKFAPYGLLPWEETGVMGRKLDKDGGVWIQTPMPESAVSQVQRKADLKLTEEGSLEGKLTVTYSGLTSLWRRLEERDEDAAQRKQFLEDGVKEYIPVGAEVELSNKPDWDSSAPTMVAEFTLKVQGWASAAGHRTLLPETLFGNGEKHTFEHTNRVHPICFHYPYEDIDDVTIELPLGLQVQSVPSEKSKDEKVIAYFLKTDNQKNAVHVHRDFRVNIWEIDPKYYLSLRSFYELVRTGDEEQIVLQPIS